MYQYDSRKISKNDIFICLPGGENYIQEALNNGAKSIIKCTRSEMASIINKYFNNPSKKLCVIGITGTNGKTSVSQIVHHALTKLGAYSSVIGTLNSTLTTPESLDSQSLMATHLKNGGTHFVMEVSSHGIAQDRVKDIHFSIRCLTNISQDHLDYHQSFEAYKKTKLSFLKQKKGLAIYPEDFQNDPHIETDFLLGDFNQLNLKAAKQILLRCGYAENDILMALKSVPSVAGRFEKIKGSYPFTILIDYAHTPDALTNVLQSAKALCASGSRLCCLFGCGGDRDASKRPLMAKAVEQLADYIVITQDNPRTENPEQIISDILQGFKKQTIIDIENDRKKAIYKIIKQANPKDIIVIAGKGHEKTQVFATHTMPFDDKKVAESALSDMGVT